MINLSGVEDNEGLLSRVMTCIHGPLLAGDVLVKALGYSSSEALRQSAFRDTLPVALMGLPERSLKFALSAEVAGWLIGQRINHGDKPFEFAGSSVETLSNQLKMFVLEHGYLLHERDLISLLGVQEKNDVIRRHLLDELPFGLFRIDKRQKKLFALSIEAFSHLEFP